MRNNPVVVLDDDPTGSQTVHRADLVFEVDHDLPLDRLTAPGAVTFLLANTRALDPSEAARRTRHIAARLASIETPFTLVSRGDSTLRGHLMLECECLREKFADAGRPFDLLLLAPAFFDAGRRTVRGIHEVDVDGVWTPVGQTEYATDATFGFAASDLRDHLVEMSGGRLARDEIVHLDTALLDRRDPAAVADALLSAPEGGWVVTDGRDDADYALVVTGVRAAQERGRRVLFRAGPSMVQALTGQHSAPPELDGGRLPALQAAGPHGLVVVGSHTARTSEQLTRLVAGGRVETVELDVDRLDDADARAATVDAARETLARATTVLHTSRTRRAYGDPAADLALAMRINDAVNETVTAIVSDRPAYVIAKGGITSNEVARVGCGITRAKQLGQLFPGQVSLVRAAESPDHLIGLPYVIFPGNVGGPDHLAAAVDLMDTLTGTPTACATLWPPTEAPRPSRCA